MPGDFLDLKQLHYFAETVETGTMSAAAKHCKVSQPAMSLAITELEKRLGEQLLMRGRRGVVPTDAGRAQAAKVARDERRWDIAREVHQDAGLTGRYDGLTPIEEVFTPDEIQDFDRRLGPPIAVEGFA